MSANRLNSWKSRWALGLSASAALTLVTACGAGSGVSAARPEGSVSATPSQSTSASPTGNGRFNYCGSSGVLAISNGHSVALTGCPGQLGISPLPTLTVKLGDQVEIAGLSLDYSSPRSDEPGVVTVQQTSSQQASLIPASSGTATVEIKTPFCVEAEVDGYCAGLIVRVM
jgi:hypothetical protein